MIVVFRDILEGEEEEQKELGKNISGLLYMRY